MGEHPRGAPAMLALEDGAVFHGRAFGYEEGEALGEVCFNTSMTGYQEILTDPSYKGQILTMTYPLIGNYGVNSVDVESSGPQVEGLVIRELAAAPSNYRSEQGLSEYLRESRIPGIEGVDTRALTKHIRVHGAMRGALSTTDPDPDSLVEKARRSPGLVGRDLVKEVTCEAPYEWFEGAPDVFGDGVETRAARLSVVVVDCGAKRNILRSLVARGCAVTVVPASTTPRAILDYNPDGVLFSNGPGDPEAPQYVVETARELLGSKPIFGICLGHQILGQALGGRVFKLKFGHRGSNQPVMDLRTRKVAITCQNHGFGIETDSLPQDSVELTHVNLNDKTCEGLRHRDSAAFSVQYHPEASAGPREAVCMFDEFVKLMES